MAARWMRVAVAALVFVTSGWVEVAVAVVLLDAQWMEVAVAARLVDASSCRCSGICNCWVG